MFSSVLRKKNYGIKKKLYYAIMPGSIAQGPVRATLENKIK